jgi:hypothetical protein
VSSSSLFRFELKRPFYGMEWENIAHPAQVEGDRPPRVSYSSWLKPTPTHTVLAISPGLRRFRVRLAPLTNSPSAGATRNSLGMGGPQGRWLRLMPSRSTEISTELGIRSPQTEPAAGLTLRMEREEGTT